MARERKIQDGREGKREREKKIEQICVYIYTRERASWRRNKETEIEKRRDSRSERGGEKRIKDDETSRET